MATFKHSVPSSSNTEPQKEPINQIDPVFLEAIQKNELHKISQILPEPHVTHAFAGYMAQGNHIPMATPHGLPFDRVSRKRPLFNAPDPSECPFKLPKEGHGYSPDYYAAANEVKQELYYVRNNSLPLHHTCRLLELEMGRLGQQFNPEWVDLSSYKAFDQITLSQKILLPEPRKGVNVVGRILGKGGSTLQQITQTYHCRIQVFGRGSKGGSESESRMLRGGNPRFAHFAMPLHCVVTVEAQPSDAFFRMAKVVELITMIIHMSETFEHDGIRIELHSSLKTLEQGNNIDMASHYPNVIPIIPIQNSDLEEHQHAQKQQDLLQEGK